MVLSEGIEPYVSGIPHRRSTVELRKHDLEVADSRRLALQTV